MSKTPREVVETLIELDQIPDKAAIIELFAEDAVFQAPVGRIFHGKAQIAPNLWQLGFPPPHRRMDAVVVAAEGDTAIMEWTWTGRHEEPLTLPNGRVIPPTGKTAYLNGLTKFVVVDGKIKLMRRYSDNTPMDVQLEGDA